MLSFSFIVRIMVIDVVKLTIFVHFGCVEGSQNEKLMSVCGKVQPNQKIDGIYPQESGYVSLRSCL